MRSPLHRTGDQYRIHTSLRAEDLNGFRTTFGSLGGHLEPRNVLQNVVITHPQMKRVGTLHSFLSCFTRPSDSSDEAGAVWLHKPALRCYHAICIHSPKYPAPRLCPRILLGRRQEDAFICLNRLRCSSFPTAQSQQYSRGIMLHHDATI